MSWVEVAFIVVFIGFSLLRRRRSSTPPRLPPVGGEDEQPPRAEVLSLGSMLAGWEGAIAAQMQQAQQQQVQQQLPPLPPVVQQAPAEVAVRLPVALKKPKSAPARAERPAPLAMAEVDRAAEHVRFHERYAEGAAPASVARSRATLQIRGKNELRRAVLLAEVLGPPRSMRELEVM